MTRFDAFFGAVILFLAWELYVGVRDMFSGTDTYECFLRQERERQIRRAIRRAHWAKQKARMRSIIPKLQRLASSIGVNLTDG